jgi:intracellular sulfur oxidation DsrE/DsrF family protein
MIATRPFLVLAVFSLAAVGVEAQQLQRRAGPVIQSAGGVFPVPDPDFDTPLDHTYRLAFEIHDAAPSPDQMNVGLNTVARFLNMHAAAGAPLERLQAAVVMHGPAGKDLLDNDAYRERLGVDNPNVALVRELAEAGVRIILCGQTAASRGLSRDRLLEPVEVALSAMTALVVLQDRGYHVNPF